MNKKTIIIAVLLLIIVGLLSYKISLINQEKIIGAVEGEINPHTFNIIVIGWDAVQRDHFFQCYNKQLPECPNGLPNIKKLSGGKIFNSTITDGATETKPGWAQILTGYNAKITGVINNGMYHPIPENYTVFEKLENYFGKDNIVTLFISGKTGNLGGVCPRKPDTCNQSQIENRGQPYCITREHLDYFKNCLGANQNVGNRALQLLENYSKTKFFAFFHFEEPDATGHVYGENSIEYSKQIIDDDKWLGKIMDKLSQLNISDNTIIYVITDHGFDENRSNHFNAPYGFMASNDRTIIRSGDRKDLTPTILKKYNIHLGAIRNAPAVNGYPLDSNLPFSCVAEGRAYIDYPSSPKCCSGLKLINLNSDETGSCVNATGGTGDNSGYCTKCGDGQCKRPENKCNCPVDCKQYSKNITYLVEQ